MACITVLGPSDVPPPPHILSRSYAVGELPGLLYRSSCRPSNVERPVSDIGNTANGSVDARVDDDFIINNLPTASTTTKIRPTGQIPISPQEWAKVRW